MEIKMSHKIQDFYVAEFIQQGAHMECSPKEEFYKARMVLSMSSSKRNYCSPHAEMSKLHTERSLERGGKFNRE